MSNEDLVRAVSGDVHLRNSTTVQADGHGAPNIGEPGGKVGGVIYESKVAVGDESVLEESCVCREPAGEQEDVGIAIAIEVGDDRNAGPRNHRKAEVFRMGLERHPTLIRPEIQEEGWPVGIGTRVAGDEEIAITVVVEVRRRPRACTPEGRKGIVEEGHRGAIGLLERNATRAVLREDRDVRPFVEVEVGEDGRRCAASSQVERDFQTHEPRDVGHRRGVAADRFMAYAGNREKKQSGEDGEATREVRA